MYLLNPGTSVLVFDRQENWEENKMGTSPLTLRIWMLCKPCSSAFSYSECITQMLLTQKKIIRSILVCGGMLERETKKNGDGFIFHSSDKKNIETLP